MRMGRRAFSRRSIARSDPRYLRRRPEVCAIDFGLPRALADHFRCRSLIPGRTDRKMRGPSVVHPDDGLRAPAAPSSADLRPP
jgi:hypothetical protein